MKTFIIYGFALLLAINFFGCLVGHRIIYEVYPNKSEKGNAIVWYYNIRSDAITDQEFEEDKNNLFNYLVKSDKFIEDVKAEGKTVLSRELYLEDNKLIGKAEFNYFRLNDVEGLTYEDGFYFLTVALDDSVVSTNGEVIKSANYKRIIWDESIKPLRFEILTEPSKDTKLRDLTSFYKQNQ